MPWSDHRKIGERMYYFEHCPMCCGESFEHEPDPYEDGWWKCESCNHVFKLS